jgi:hypothetical protein
MAALHQWMSALSGVFAHHFAGFDPAAGTLTLPLWTGWALGVLLLICLILIFGRARHDGPVGLFARLALVLLGAGGAWAVSQIGPDRAAERNALATRAAELAARGGAPGSPLACLDENGGETVETLCEKALFATPESTAAAVSYAAAQLSLLTDISAYARNGDNSLEPIRANLRRAIERDRFGMVAHLLALREGCTPDQCPAFALLGDSSRVSTNLNERTYDFYVVRHAGGWPAIANPAMAAASPPQTVAAPGANPPGVAPTVAARTPANGLFFPSASSIPPVNIMNAEAPQQAAPEPAAKPAAARKSTPPTQQAKRPAQKRAPPPTPAETDDSDDASSN